MAQGQQGQRARLSVGNPHPSQHGAIFSTVGRSCRSYLSAWYFWRVLTDRAPLLSCANSVHRARPELCARVLPPTPTQRDTRWKGRLSSHPSFASSGLQATHSLPQV